LREFISTATNSEVEPMEKSYNPHARCAELIATLGQAWDITTAQAAAYAQAISAYLPEACTDAELQHIVWYYHLDHAEVQALSDARHPEYEAAWQHWHTQVARILRSVNLDWLTDVAVDLEDLTQLALDKLRESIASYRFNSRFSTWAYTVIVRTAQHVIRKQHAAKRTATVVSLDSATARTSPADRTTDPEAHASARELTALINVILAEHGGRRWVEIFQLWFYEDQRLVDIGRQVGLSPSRVSILLEHMRLLLRQHPALIEWRPWAEDVIEQSGIAVKMRGRRHNSPEGDHN
jgi:RNA polymerase sigma factor (sigma-70 family)